MTKKFCDKCGREVKQGESQAITVTYGNNSYRSSPAKITKDICHECLGAMGVTLREQLIVATALEERLYEVIAEMVVNTVAEVLPTAEGVAAEIAKATT